MGDALLFSQRRQPADLCDGVIEAGRVPQEGVVRIRKLFLTAVQEILLQNKDPKATLGEAQTRAQDLMPKP